jgi:hypothetical protein
MKRTLLDITKKINRTPLVVSLTPNNLTDSTYWIFEAIGYRFVEVLREIEIRNSQNRLSIFINSQNIGDNDYIVEAGDRGLLVKFVKSNFQYELDSEDYIEIKGDLEKYA